MKVDSGAALGGKIKLVGGHLNNDVFSRLPGLVGEDQTILAASREGSDSGGYESKGKILRKMK